MFRPSNLLIFLFGAFATLVSAQSSKSSIDFWILVCGNLFSSATTTIPTSITISSTSIRGSDLDEYSEHSSSENKHNEELALGLGLGFGVTAILIVGVRVIIFSPSHNLIEMRFNPGCIYY
jgi:hypothetical protein